MKLYVKSSYARDQQPRYADWAKAIKADIRNVASCKSQEDLDNLEIQSYNSNYIKGIWNSRFEKMGITDFDEKIDNIIDWLYDNLNHVKEYSDKFSKEVASADVIADKIANYLDGRYDYKVEPEGIVVMPEDLSRDALINFIDDLIAALNGRYFVTARGGSWTSWNIKISGEDGPDIEYQIGPTDDGSAWLIREV